MGYISRTVKSIKVESVNHLFQLIQEYNSNGDKWFRGQSNTSYDLQPSAYRKLYRVADYIHRPVKPELVDMYLTSGDDIFVPDNLYLTSFFDFLDNEKIEYDEHANLIEKICLAQHYGVRTCLLDWSTDATVAIFFALDGRKDNNEAALFILDPIKLNSLTVSRNYILSTDETIELVQDLPVAFFGPRKDKRMCRQSGNFTSHGTNVWPLDYYPISNDYLVKLEIPCDICRELNDLLFSLGINHDSVYVGSDVKDEIAKKAQKHTELAIDREVRNYTKKWEEAEEKGNIHVILSQSW